MTRRLQSSGCSGYILAFSGLGLNKVIRFASGASTTTSTVSGSVTTNTKFKVGAHLGIFGGRYGTDMGRIFCYMCLY